MSGYLDEFCFVRAYRCSRFRLRSSRSLSLLGTADGTPRTLTREIKQEMIRNIAFGNCRNSFRGLIFEEFGRLG